MINNIYKEYLCDEDDLCSTINDLQRRSNHSPAVLSIVPSFKTNKYIIIYK